MGNGNVLNMHWDSANHEITADRTALERENLGRWVSI